jgi:hypothetical protein
MQAIGGCNPDPDSFDVRDDLIAFGCGPCIIVQSLSTFSTVAFIPLKWRAIRIFADDLPVTLIDPVFPELHCGRSFSNPNVRHS